MKKREEGRVGEESEGKHLAQYAWHEPQHQALEKGLGLDHLAQGHGKADSCGEEDADHPADDSLELSHPHLR